jgi:dTDP-4-amino-4,6-dideoxygalactose transaminase
MIDITNGYVINPESFWRPSYRISPFNTGYVKKNKQLIQSGTIDFDLVRNFFGSHYFFCNNGKSAISLALQQYDLSPEDEVLILTTSGNTYISSCVTKEIENICKWSRVKTEKTKLVFVNHEFGFCYEELAKLKEYQLPIIEDRALSFASVAGDGKTGTIGDFVIYSLPKFFPISLGGVLQCNNSSKLKSVPAKNQLLDDYCARLMTSYLEDVERIKKERTNNFAYLEKKFAEFDFHPFFEVTGNAVPGVFMFSTKGIDLNRFKIFMQANGVESSIFYGKEAFFVPVHQELTVEDMDFFYQLTLYFISHGTK